MYFRFDLECTKISSYEPSLKSKVRKWVPDENLLLYSWLRAGERIHLYLCPHFAIRVSLRCTPKKGFWLACAISQRLCVAFTRSLWLSVTPNLFLCSSPSTVSPRGSCCIFWKIILKSNENKPCFKDHDSLRAVSQFSFSLRTHPSGFVRYGSLLPKRFASALM